MAWQPQPDGLNQTVALLAAVSNPGEPQVHQQALAQLEHFRSTVADFNCYLVLILAKGHQHGDGLRQLAGVHLKNNFREQIPMSEAVVAYLKTELIGTLGDSVKEIRRIAAVTITNLLSIVTLARWPELCPTLLQMIESGIRTAVDGALCAFELICEDHTQSLCETAGVTDVFVPRLLQFFMSEEAIFRQRAIQCLNEFLFLMPNALVQQMPNFIEGLLRLHMDTNVEVRKLVCQAFVMLVEIRADYLQPRIRDVVERLLWSTEQDPEYEVRKEACEFWSSVTEPETLDAEIQPYLPRLIPILLHGMIYSEEELFNLQEEDEEEDRPEDINPALYSYKSKHGGGDGPGSDEEEEEEEEEEEDDLEADWTLRKCSAQGLDCMSNRFSSLILEPLLPLLHQKLSSPDWIQKESAILAAGAIAYGCVTGLIEKNYLGPLVEHLISSTAQEPMPLVKSITCWTLSRYSKWICEQATQFLPPLVQCLLECILSPNKKVQEAACSAFATLGEEAQQMLIPFLQPILQTMSAAFGKYKARNMLMLYDAVGTLADSIGSDLSQPEHISVLIPPLIFQWNRISDTDKALFPLLECLTSVVQALGAGFEPYAVPVFKRCVKLIQVTLEAQIALATNPGDESIVDPDDEFIVCSLDLIAALAEGLQSSIESLVSSHPLIPLILECSTHHSAEVRQSAFALVGDLAKSCTLHLRPYLSALLPVMIQNLNPDYMSVCNNATWALGEIAIQVREEMASIVPALLEPLCSILFKQKLTKSLHDNTAITIGRLVFAAPDLLAQHMNQFIQPLCEILSQIRDDVEKEDAFKGVVIMIQKNPQHALDSFRYICGAFCSWKALEAYPELATQIIAVLQWLKQNLQAKGAWETYYNTLDDATKQNLVAKFGVS